MSERTVVHVDMDAFFASVEVLDDPSLRGKPVLVGGGSDRGVVAAASYEARRFGVRSAMAMVKARSLCPTAVVVSPRHGRYAEVSEAVFAIFERYTPLVEGLSLDEAFLDVTQSRARFGDGETIARAIKAAIADELGLTASAGVAPCKFVAKIASDVRKPDGLCVVPATEVRAFLAPMPVERMWGVGEKTAERAHAFGYHRLADLAAAEPESLRAVFGSHGPTMGALARGEDVRPVVPDREARSIGAEDTYEVDLVGETEVKRALLAQCMRVAARLVDAQLEAKVVHLKLRFADFTVTTRQTTLHEPTYDTDTLHRAVCALYDAHAPRGARYRLTGVSVSQLGKEGGHRSLFPDEAEQKRKAVEQARAALRARFGEAAVTRASLLDATTKRMRDGGRERS